MPAALKAVPMPKPSAKVTNITPKMASDWLAKNGKNRNIRSSLVNLYARDMAAKNWQFTGEAIKFDIDGALLDGQHRLLAIVKAGVTLPMLVIRDLVSDSQGVMDSGAKRTAGDALGLAGHKNTAIIAAVARFDLLHRQNLGLGNSVSHSEVATWVDENPGIIEAAKFAAFAKSSIDLRPTATAYCWMVLSRVNGGACADFFDALMNQSTDGRGDPRSTLLRRLALARRNGERLSTESQVQFVIRAWNAWRKGEALNVLKVRTAGANGDVVNVSIPKAI